MIVVWLPSEKGLVRQEASDGRIPAEAVWLDAIDITREEETLLESTLGIDIPTRDEMQGIESSSRLYRDGGAVFMTTTMLIKTETAAPETAAVTFVLTSDKLVTLRYSEPWSFRIFAQRAGKLGLKKSDMVFIALLETTVERLADLLELVSVELEHLSQKIFRPHSEGSELNLQKALFNVGRSGNICSKVRESLVDKNRLIIFAEQATIELMCAEGRARVHAIHRDIQSLSDQATFTAGKIAFLLDATLGLINIEQNRIIKLFSIAAVVFMPPTMIASVYGMNFGESRMPELSWKYGYEYSIALMIASVVGTLWFFKRKRWL